MKLYQGSPRCKLVIHDWPCLTPDLVVAERYAGRMGEVFEVELDLAPLTVVEVPGYDHDTNEAPADDEAFRAARAAEGADVLVYEDEDERGREHTCYRLVSER